MLFSRSVRRVLLGLPWFALPALSVGAATLPGCDSSGPTVAESLAAAQEKEKGPPGYVPKAKPRPTGLEGPTEAELKAWDRKDPEGEKHLYKWDKAHMDDMMHYWHQMECFREKVKAEGDKAFGSEPGSELNEQWFQFKRGFVAHLDGWQKRIFAEQPRVQEKSKFIGNFLEAHELVMNGYLRAYNDADKRALQKQDAHWLIVEAKNKKYVKSLGAKWPERDMSKPKVAAAHAKFCEAALAPPDRSGKAKKRRGKKSSI